MKLFSIALLSAPLFAEVAQSWQPVHTIFRYLRITSRIPQFIHDAQHPWLEQNKVWIERLDDPKQELCSLDSRLRRGNHANVTVTGKYPTTFFQSLEINNNRYGIHRGGWSNARARLKEMLQCPAALQDVKRLKVEIWVSDGSYGIGVKEPPSPPSDLPDLFSQTLSLMHNLEHLDWSTHGNGNEEFRQSLCGGNLVLPSVRHLRIAEFMDCLVATCPSLTAFESAGYWRWRPWRNESDPRLDMIRSAAKAENLTSFSLGGEWALEHVQATLEAMPCIENLEIDGELAPSHTYNKSILQSFVHTLSQFSRLKHLGLPPSFHLALGFDGGSPCGNVYFGPYGPAEHRRVAEENAKTIEEAAEMVLAQMPNLETLSIGSNCANVTKQESGQSVAVYPWTGRIKSWAYENWPGIDFPTLEGVWADLDIL